MLDNYPNIKQKLFTKKQEEKLDDQKETDKKIPFHLAIIAMLNGDYQADLEKCAMDGVDYFGPSIAVLASKAIIPEDGIEPLTQAFINAVKENGDPDLCNGVALFLENVDGGAEALKKALADDQFSGDEEENLQAIARIIIPGGGSGGET